MATDAPAPTGTQKPTALSLLREEIFRFLETDTPEVLCIRGKWGVGKTYTWETLLKEAQQSSKVKLQSYSYVSLFGLDNLDRFKSSVFESVIPVASAGSDPNIETLGTNIKAVAKLAASAWKPGLGALADHAAFLAVKQYIVCIDDLERKGEKLRIIDVLGLTSLLRERRKCKVVLILNDEELSEGDHEAFEKYSEKVIDSSLVFEPTSEEACKIAIKGTTPNDDLLRE
jgi:Cdc6-like AAA superfamily ATPase